MSADGNRIICRQCGESIPLDSESCPNCGKNLRSRWPYVVGLLFGGVLVVSAVVGFFMPDVNGLTTYGVIGLIIAFISGFTLYERRQRIERAGEESQQFQADL